MRSSLASPAVAAFPEISIGSASALLFSRPAQRSLTFGLPARRSPKATPYTEGFSRFVTSTTAPIATGWSDSCRAGLTPAGRPCLCTAHQINKLRELGAAGLAWNTLW